MTFPLAPHAPASAEPKTFLWDNSRADKVVRFFRIALVLGTDEGAPRPFILTPWQEHQIIRPLFATVTWDEHWGEYLRQYRTAWIELGRKNGKTELMAGIALFMLLADGEHNAQVFSVAKDAEQAKMVFEAAEKMVKYSPRLRKMTEGSDPKLRVFGGNAGSNTRSMVYYPSNSRYRVMPGDASGALGTRPSAILFDEVVAQRDRYLWDAMRQGFGTRRQPLMIAGTTAGYTSSRFCLEEHEYSERVAADPTMDPSRLVFMRNTPQEWDWEDEGQPAEPDEGKPATGWYHANPALGDFLSVDALRTEAREAKQKPSAQNSFRVFRLNQWTGQASRWIDMAVWRENGQAKVRREALIGRPCYGGLDLASVSDFTAWVLLFPGSPDNPDDRGFTVLPHFFIPRSAVEKRSAMQDEFMAWERAGLVTVNAGQSTDYDAMEDHILRDANDFKVMQFGYDPWNARQTVGHLEDGGLAAVEVSQKSSRLNDPCKQLESLVAERRLYHGGNPILSWMADNLEVKADEDGNIRPSKSKSGEKIDGISALVTALYVAGEPVTEGSSAAIFFFDDLDDEDEET